MAATAAAVEAAGQLLRALASARQTVALYPRGHPARDQHAHELDVAATALREATPRGEPTIHVDRGGLYLGTTLLVHPSLSLGSLTQTLLAAGVESLTLTRGATAADLEALAEVVAEGREAPPRLGGALVNAVRPADNAEEPWQQRLRDLRRAYAGGYQALGEASARVADGLPVDLERVSGAVENLVDEVSQDTGYGLLLSAAKSYDEYTYFHMVNVCLLSVALGEALGLRRDQVLVLGLGALLHDIGKVYVPEDVLRATGSLDEEQWRLVQRHPIDGAGLLLSTGAGLFHPAAAVVLEHHAGYDGGGYPEIHGHGQSPASRVVAVADCFDAVTSRRPYREPLSRHEALGILVHEAGTGFDPAAVGAFERLLGEYPTGSLVELTSGEIAVVVRPGAQPDRPTVLVLLDGAGAEADVAEHDLGADERLPRIARRLSERDAGVDLSRFVVSGELHARTPAPEADGGLVHEPSPGEPPPAGYVDTHGEERHHHHVPADSGRVDPDVAPPIDIPRPHG